LYLVTNIHQDLFKEYKNLIVNQPEIMLCRYNGDVASVSIIHLSLFEQMTLIDRKYETNRFHTGNFLSNMTQFILKGSIKVWNNENWESSDVHKLYRSGDILITKNLVDNENSVSPSYKFFNSNKYLLQYSSNTITIEYNRELLPLWLLRSFIHNLIHLDFSCLFNIFYHVVESYRIDYLFSSFIETTHECCSQPFLKLFNS
jgi:hypothetical protein